MPRILGFPRRKPTLRTPTTTQPQEAVPTCGTSRTRHRTSGTPLTSRGMQGRKDACKAENVDEDSRPERRRRDDPRCAASRPFHPPVRGDLRGKGNNGRATNTVAPYHASTGPPVSHEAPRRPAARDHFTTRHGLGPADHPRRYPTRLPRAIPSRTRAGLEVHNGTPQPPGYRRSRSHQTRRIRHAPRPPRHRERHQQRTPPRKNHRDNRRDRDRTDEQHQTASERSVRGGRCESHCDLPSEESTLPFPSLRQCNNSQLRGARPTQQPELAGLPEVLPRRPTPSPNLHIRGPGQHWLGSFFSCAPPPRAPGRPRPAHDSPPTRCSRVPRGTKLRRRSRTASPRPTFVHL
jgi:hypothetical protein